ncbi:MAG: leucine-rich repeat protein, partial [Candidatus Izemoplasmatales bacterium]|nr:leucine-rich repeat protein [Candidatus Izemoplasmatales bacterium]
YSYLIDFETNGADEIDSIYVIENTRLSPVDIERVGYTFDGWYLEENFLTLFDFSVFINQEYTLYAKWSKNTYKISFNTNGGGLIEDSYIEFEQPIDLITPTMDGMDFAGWFLDIEYSLKFEYDVMPAHDIKLYAKWITKVIDFTYSIKDEVVEITSYLGNSEKVIIPDFIDDLPVLKIGENAFMNNTTIKELYIYSNIFYIGDFAFSGLINLEKIFLPSGVYEVGIGVFFGNENIQLIEISSELNYNLSHYFNGVDNIPEHSFVIRFSSGSSSVSTSLLNSDLKNVVLELAKDSLSIDYSLFRNNNFIKHLVIPDGISKIDDYAFENMSALQSIVLPNSIETIGKNIFRGDISLESITTPYIGKTRTSIRKEGVLGYFFSETDYTGSTMVRQKEGSGYIDGVVFYISSSLRRVVLTDSEVLQEGTFHNASFIEEVVLPEGLITIGEYSLSNSGIKSISIPASLKDIDRYAFYESDNLENIYFSEGSLLESVDNYAFGKCISLKEVVFPVGLKSIGQEVFRYNENLYYVYIPESVEKIGSLSFHNLEKTVIYTGASSNKVEWQLIPVKIYYDIDRIEKNDEFGFAISNSNDAMIISYYGSSSEVNIPNTYNNLLVIGIMDRVFEDNLLLENVNFEIDSNIEIIGDYAFANCEKINSIKLPDSLVEIGSYSFYNTSLSEIYIGENVELIDDYAFYYTNLFDLNFSENSNLQLIGYKAFNGLYIVEVEIPNTVVFIDDSAFAFNENMTSFTFEEGIVLEKIPEYFLYKNSQIEEIILPKSIKEIGYGAFSFMTSLSTFTIEDDSQLNFIDNMAFAECVNLKRIIFPVDLEVINENAFYHCVKLSEVVFMSLENLLHIGSKAFYQCESLVSVVLPDSVTTIDSRAFYQCVNLSSINIPTSLEVVSVEVFYQTSITSVVIPKNVKQILTYAFGGVSSLESLIFENESLVTSIADYAFVGTGISEVIIPKSVVSLGRNVISPNLKELYFEDESSLLVIEQYTFYNNPYLEVVKLPSNLQEIGYSAFGCPAPITTFGQVYNYVLERVYIPASVVIIDAQAFRNVMNLTIYTEHETKPSGWDDNFNLRTKDTYHEVIYGVELDEL